MGMLPKRANRTLLENQLVVEANRKVDVHHIAENVRHPSIRQSECLEFLLATHLLCCCCQL